MKKLIKDCKKLNRKAQREMVNHLSPFLFPVCRRYSNSTEDAKDLLQESLILIFNNMDRFSSDNKIVFKSWCKRITINAALSKIRKKNIKTEALSSVSTMPTTPPVIHSELNVNDILKLLESLPSNQQIVFNLSVLDGFSHQEIAKILNIEKSSSRTFLSRARQTLRALINTENQIATSDK